MIFLILLPGYSIIRHYRGCFLCRSLQAESSFCERLQMFLKFSSRIDRKLSECIMGVSAAFSGPSSRPVFYHSVDAVFSPAVFCIFCSLKAVAVCSCHLYCPLPIQPQGILEPHPPGICGQIDLRSQGRGDPQGPVFSGNDFSKFLHSFRIKKGCHPDSFRPFGNFSCSAFILCLTVCCAMTGV